MQFKSKFSFFVLLLIMVSLSLESNPMIDSLKNELNNDLHDTTRSLLLSRISFTFIRENIDSGIVYAKQGLNISNRINYLKGKQYNLNSLANNYVRKAEPDSAIIHFEKLLSLLKKDNHLLMGLTYDNMALAYQKISDYPTALDYHYNAIKEFKEINDKGRILNVSHNMGLIYTKQKKYRKAKDHYLQLLESAEIREQKQKFSRIYKSLSNMYMQLNLIDSAEYFSKLSLKIDNESGVKQSIAISTGNMANIYFVKKDFKKAIQLYNKAIQLEKEIGNREGLARNYMNIGELYLNLFENGDNNKFDKSKYFLKESIKIYNSYGEKFSRLSALKLLAKLYESNGEFKNAYENMQSYTLINDSLTMIQTSESMRNLEIKRDQKLRQKELELLRKENDYNMKVNTYLIILSVLVICILIIALKLYRTIKNQNDKLEIGIQQRTKELENAKTDLYESLASERDLSEMKSNFITTISHEFRTPLTAISNTAAIIQQAAKDVDGINAYAENILQGVKNLDDLVENILNFSTKDASLVNWVPQDVDINEFAQEIVNWSKGLEKDSPNIYYTTEIINQKIRTDRDLLEKALKPILRNAVRFTDESKEVKLLFKEEDNNFMIFVKDQGQGIEAEDLKYVFEPFYKSKKDIGLKSGTGLGLSISKKYVEVLNGKISIESKLNMGTIITIIIPKH